MSKDKGKWFKQNSSDLEPEVTPQHEHQKHIKNDNQLLNAKYKTVKEWYELKSHPRGEKLIKCKQKANGNVNRIYVCLRKQHEDYVKKLINDGEIRVA